MQTAVIALTWVVIYLLHMPSDRPAPAESGDNGKIATSGPKNTRDSPANYFLCGPRNFSPLKWIK